MVECQLPKLKVAGSNPVSRSNKNKDLADLVKSFFVVREQICARVRLNKKTALFIVAIPKGNHCMRVDRLMNI